MATKAIKKKVTVAAVEEKAKEIKKKPAVKKKAAAKKITVKKASAKPVSKKAEAKKINSTSYLIIDHPIDMETIYGNHYAIRIGASPDGYVEISFNNGEWQPCRYGGGYWWYDWTNFAQGDYSIAVRLIGSDGKALVETVPRKCRIC